MRYNWSDHSWILLAVICIVCFFMPVHGFGNHAAWYNAFTYHFFHANIWHLLGNLCALWIFKPKRETCLIGYALASLIALVPFAAIPGEITCGLSGLLFAGYARRYVLLHLDIKWILLFISATAFIPHLNWRVHALCFIIGLIVWRIRYYDR